MTSGSPEAVSSACRAESPENPCAAPESPAERTKRILRERAGKLARPLKQVEAQDLPELVVFRLGDELYGIALSCVAEVVPLGELTPVPHTPDWVKGVFGYRGRVLTLVDLRPLLAAPAVTEELPAGKRRILVIVTPAMTLGVLAETLVGVVRSAVAAVRFPSQEQTPGRPALVLGVAAGKIAVLDVPALTQHLELGAGSERRSMGRSFQ